MNTRSMIFTLYGDFIRHYGGEIWTGSLITLLEEFGHNEQSVRAAISRMNKQGWVKSIRRGNRSYYQMTEKGKERLEEAALRIFKFKPHHWDGKWRIVSYSIPEEIRNIRDEFRKELVWSGFGSLPGGIWISPNSLEKQVDNLIRKYEIKNYVHMFLSEYLGPKTNKEIIKEGWDIKEINEKYSEFIKRYSQKYIIDRTKIQKGEMTDGECFVERTILVHEYRKFLFIDPGLPEELLPDEWLGDSAAELFASYYKELAQPAQQFFESVFYEGNTKKKEKIDLSIHPYMNIK
ncbi:MAG TPA: phenylacetic acid degradation operon negative regulatory protein PaaX [Massilibacterium sp.]|mgnify:CR=1 FL=1|nr:phenylacetic acid degradation operon negative regulatory protein PaaX [Massilibacterium sp.]